MLTMSLFAGNVFKRGDISLGVIAGSGNISYKNTTSSISKDYFIVGANVDYFVYDNLSVGLDIRGWIGEEPNFMQYTLPVTYYIYTRYRIYPYIGAFYRYNAYSDSSFTTDNGYNKFKVEDYSSLGARTGFIYKVDFGYVGFGWTFERDIKHQANNDYPEFILGFVF